MITLPTSIQVILSKIQRTDGLITPTETKMLADFINKTFPQPICPPVRKFPFLYGNSDHHHDYDEA
jgi:hypothetical protein